jgi:hypothetical protein
MEAKTAPSFLFVVSLGFFLRFHVEMEAEGLKVRVGLMWRLVGMAISTIFIIGVGVSLLN